MNEISFLVYNADINEFEELVMDQQDYQDMVEYEKQLDLKEKELRKAKSEKEHHDMQYDRF